jgi:enediyne biosynthesis protein E4
VEFDPRNPPRRNSSCVFLGIEVYCGPTGFVGVPDILYHNNGDGTFTDVTAKAGITDLQNKYNGLGVTWGDYDNDGWPDIFVANDITPRYLWHNNHDGTFTDQGTMSGVAYDEQGMTQGSMGVDFGDYDNDGWLDITETNFSGEPKELYHNLQNGLFEDLTYPSGIGDISFHFLSWGTQFIDYDNDGWLDIFTVNGHVYPEMDRPGTGTSFYQRPLLFRNEGNLRFEEVGESSGEDMKKRYNARGSAYGDFDNDGDIDVLVNNIDGPPRLFRNDGGNQLNWLEIKLIGTRSNRDAVGARLTLRAGGLRQIREIKAGGSFASTSDPRAHFGLGKATKVDSLEIRWPSGTLETLKDLPVNKFLTLTEGKSASGG